MEEIFLIHIIVISHGNFCEALLNSMQMISGEQQYIEAVPLLPEDSPETYRERLQKILEKHNGKDGILILSDIIGGTPFNSAVYLAQSFKIGLVTGMNMPMLLNLVLNRTEETTLEELLEMAVQEDTISVTAKNLSIAGGKKREKLSVNKN